MRRADSSEYFAGTALNELSECHSRLPRLNSRRRSSRASSLLSLSRLETSLHVHATSRRSCALRDVAGRLLQRAEVAAERQLLLVGEVLVVEHQHGVVVHAGLIAAASARDSGCVMSTPDTSPAKNGRETGSIGRIGQRHCCSSVGERKEWRR